MDVICPSGQLAIRRALSHLVGFGPKVFQQHLGRKNIENTLKYTGIEETLFQGLPDEFTSKVADSTEEACKLIEAGFDHVGNIHETEIFRKRK